METVEVKRVTKKPIKKKVSNQRLTASSVSDDLEVYMAETDHRIAKLEFRLAELEESLANTPAADIAKTKVSLPTLSDFKFFVTTYVYRLAMAALIFYGAYSFVGADVVKGWFINNQQQKQIDLDDISGTLFDVSKRYSSALTDTAGLQQDLSKLLGGIDTAPNPISELRLVIQYEAGSWRDAVGAKFLQEARAGRSPSELIKEIIRGLEK